MNNSTIYLSSSSSNYYKIFEELELDDLTTLNVCLSSVYSASVPLYLKISWGDSVVETFDNNLYRKVDDKITSFNGLLNLFEANHTHIFYPSSDSLYLRLSSQVLVEYPDGNKNWFVIPIKIRTYGYIESIGDITLINTNIIPEEGNRKEYQFNIDRGNYVIEMRES